MEFGAYKKNVVCIGQSMSRNLKVSHVGKSYVEEVI